MRRSEAGEAAAQWAAIDALGYADALVPAECGGAGLSLSDAFPLFLAAGRAGLSHPFAEDCHRPRDAGEGGARQPGRVHCHCAVRG
ncbi:hypothetical protein ACU4GD_20515 [Cupriavidus basilensis]